jgi:hypothetical protein
MSDEISVVVRYGGPGAGSRATSAGKGSVLNRRRALAIAVPWRRGRTGAGSLHWARVAKMGLPVAAGAEFGRVSHRNILGRCGAECKWTLV